MKSGSVHLFTPLSLFISPSLPHLSPHLLKEYCFSRDDDDHNIGCFIDGGIIRLF